MVRAALAAVCCVCLVAPAPVAGQSPSHLAQAGRYVDFHQALADPNVAVVVGTLGKPKEGKRERLAEGQLGGAGSVSSVSGTQYFKVPVTAKVQVRSTFQGKVDNPALAFDVQVARLPDGKEQRQTMLPNAAKLGDGTLALFVLRPRPKGKGHELVGVIPFDEQVDAAQDAEAGFVDTMHDFYVVNRHVLDLEQALRAFDEAAAGKAREDAARLLQQLVTKRPELKQVANDNLWAQHAGALEARARQRLAEAGGKPVATPPEGGGK